MFRKSFVTFESNELSQSKFEIRRLIIFAINVQNFESKYRELTEMSRFPSGYIFLCPTLYIENSRGDNGHPCLTPLPMIPESDSPPAILTNYNN